jgi:uncharacterized protein DUF4288
MALTRRRPRRRKPNVTRYAAKLLFQFRVVVNGDAGVRRLCEERMIVFRAASAGLALAKAKRRGRAAQHRYKNKAGDTVHFEFVGILDLLALGMECEADEVWYDLVERVRPMERRHAILPKENDLSAIRLAGRNPRSRGSAS